MDKMTDKNNRTKITRFVFNSKMLTRSIPIIAVTKLIETSRSSDNPGEKPVSTSI